MVFGQIFIKNWFPKVIYTFPYHGKQLFLQRMLKNFARCWKRKVADFLTIKLITETYQVPLIYLKDRKLALVSWLSWQCFHLSWETGNGNSEALRAFVFPEALYFYRVPYWVNQLGRGVPLALHKNGLLDWFFQTEKASIRN